MERRRREGGFSLIEVLVATSIFSFGMGGMAALMLSAAGGMAEAEHETIANLGADAVAATLQLSPVALEHLANPPRSAPLCFEDDVCSAQDWAVSRYLLWRAQISHHLPEGAVVACRDSSPMDGTADDPACDGGGPEVIKVFWVEPRRKHDADGGARRAVMQVPR